MGWVTAQSSASTLQSIIPNGKLFALPPILIPPASKMAPDEGSFFRMLPGEDEYQKLSPARDQLKAFSEQFGKMEMPSPVFQMTSCEESRCNLDRRRRRDEIIKREDTDHMAARSVQAN